MLQLCRHESTKNLINYGKAGYKLPSTVWKDSHDNDKPYRTVKTLVHKFCKGYELKILEDLDCLSLEDSNILRPLVESFLTALGYDLTNLVFAGTKSPTTEQEAQLMKIFDNLKDKELIRSALHELHAFITSHPSVDITPHLATLSDTKKVLVERILLDMRRNRAQLTSHANKLAIAAERQGFTFKPDLTEEHLTELKARPVMEVLKDTRNILSKHKDVFPNDAAAVDNVIVKLPKERAQATKSRLPTANINSISRPASSPSRSPARAGSQIPSTSMDDLKKRLEMIKKRSKPT